MTAMVNWQKRYQVDKS